MDVTTNCGDLIVGLRKDGTVVVAGKMLSSISKKSDNAIDIDAISSWTDVIAISSYGYAVVGLRSDGTLLYAGNNEYNESDKIGKWKLW